MFPHCKIINLFVIYVRKLFSTSSVPPWLDHSYNIKRIHLGELCPMPLFTATPLRIREPENETFRKESSRGENILITLKWVLKIPYLYDGNIYFEFEWGSFYHRTTASGIFGRDEINGHKMMLDSPLIFHRQKKSASTGGVLFDIIQQINSLADQFFFCFRVEGRWKNKWGRWEIQQTNEWNGSRLITYSSVTDFSLTRPVTPKQYCPRPSFPLSRLKECYFF